MAKKANNQNIVNRPPAPKPPQKSSGPTPAPQSKGMSPIMLHLISIFGIIASTYLFLSVSLNNLFTNWDDPGYVTNNPLIKDISSAGIANIFSKDNAVMGNYHPLTILTYAFDYDKVGLEPWHYHMQSLLFHIATTVLVYCFVWLLSKRMVAAVVTALLFGLHPMHVESVAWVAGRKDVVYGFFYMASCISYLYYTRGSNAMKALWYVAVIVLYGCSLLSKPVAVVLPISLLLIDIFEGRFSLAGFTEIIGNATYKPIKTSFNLFVLLDKLPLLTMSFIAGYKSLIDQKVFGALNTQGSSFNTLERIGLGGYALSTYLWKLVVPIKLLCFYPYPLKDVDTSRLPPIYYLYAAISIAIVAGAFWLFRKNRAVVFGILFFLVNIALLLQFIPVGGAIIADRYTYIPYIGLFFILGWAVSTLFDKENTKQLGMAAMGAVLAYTMVLGYMSKQRCEVWYDGMSLWRDEIEVEPVRAPNGYNNLGFFYFNKYNTAVNPNEKKLYYDSSFFLLNKAIELQPTFVNPYISLAELLRASNQFGPAKAYYYKALTLKQDDQAANAYLGLAVIYSITRKDDSANYCYVQTLKLKPYNPEAHSNYANFLDMTGRKDEAIAEYGKAIEQNPDIFQPYINRGRAYLRMEKPDMAIKDFDKAIQIEPKIGEIYYYRAMAYDKKGVTAKAQNDLEASKKLGFVPGR